MSVCYGTQYWLGSIGTGTCFQGNVLLKRVNNVPPLPALLRALRKQAVEGKELSKNASRVAMDT